jgi:gliding motility-associated-like protein
MLFKKYYLLLGLIFSTASAQYITTDESRTPLQLIEDVLLNSGCASVSNISVSGGNFTSGEKSWGYFNAVGTSFPFEEGIILSTGKIINAQGPNGYISDDGGGMGWGGDNDLNQALGLNNTFNATILEFDFIPIGNQISFDYIFSSEQYLTNPNPNQCSFTDGFVFLLKEASSSSYQNLAVIPNTNIPVKVNTVRGSGTICPAANATYFDAFNNIEHPTNFNGQTKVLTAKANVTPGQTYHIKLVIADEGNYRYDSAIFLKGNSFSTGIDLGTDRTFANQNPVCTTENITLNATTTGVLNYQWFFNDNPIPGETNSTFTLNPPYNVNQNGTYSVELTFSPTCISTSEIDLDFATELTVGQTSYTFCDTDSVQDGITTVTLSDLIPTLFLNLPTNLQVNFYNSPTSTTALSNSFLLTTPFQQTVYAKISNSTCYNSVAVTLNINTFNAIINDETTAICNNISTILTADSGFQSYTWNTGETTSSIQIASAGTYSVVIENTNGCTKVKTFTVTDSEIATIENIIISGFNENSSAEIVISGNGVYQFSIDGVNYQNSPVFTNLTGLVYTAFVKNGCGTVQKEFYLIQIPKFFTPNGDGINDIWYIKGIRPMTPNVNSIVSIFDRYGKLLTQFPAFANGWDGMYNGRLMLADDYWFVIELGDGRTARGHFSLLR